MNADQILAITIPELLFPRDPDQRKAKFHELAKQYHPDHGGSAGVFAHISALKIAADEGRWGNSKILRITEGKTGRTFELRYRAHHQFELGDLYIGSRTIGWFIKKEHEDLMLNGLRAIGLIRFPDNKMKEEHQKYLPVVAKTIEVTSVI